MVYLSHIIFMQISLIPLTTASSVSRFRVDVSDLRAGNNVIAVTFISVRGTSRTIVTRVTRRGLHALTISMYVVVIYAHEH